VKQVFAALVPNVHSELTGHIAIGFALGGQGRKRVPDLLAGSVDTRKLNTERASNRERLHSHGLGVSTPAPFKLMHSLAPNQMKFAEQCEILVRGFARVGIIALVDEATGYQQDRARDALARILEAFIVKELQPYVQTFPGSFYAELFRLRGLEFPRDSVRRPRYFGILTNDIVYKRLAPGVLEELKRVTPKNDAGRPKHKFFQHLTTNLGYPKLREHLGSVVAIMKLSDTWDDFVRKLDRLHPRYGETLPLPLEYQQDDGKGL
jgi:hypothetical protein